MAKKIKPKIVGVSLKDSEKLVEMGNLVKEKRAILQYYATDYIYYEVYDQPILPKTK